MIDITKHNICDGCDKTSKKDENTPIWEISVKNKKIRLCWDCMLAMQDTINYIINKEILAQTMEINDVQ